MFSDVSGMNEGGGGYGGGGSADFALCFKKKKFFFFSRCVCGRGGESARVRGVWFGVFLAFEESFGD